jgi:GTPase Era involved in 16S rRNA processing
MDSDRQLRDFFVERQLPLLVVATKCDKLSKQQVDRSIAAIARGLEVPSELIVPFSSETRLGRDLLLKEVESLMKDGAAAMKEARRQAAADAADRQEAEPVVIVGEDLLARPAGSGGRSRRGGR